MFDRVFGPAVHALNVARLSQPFIVETMTYGDLPAKPSCTLVIPLYGRIDYLEYQLAFLSADPASRALDIVYVLDDPQQRREVLTLAESVYARFRLPFRLLLSSANRGFGPASNLGLQAARAPYVAFVNSDVCPDTSGWTDRLIATLKKNPKIGAVGPRLLYEDGSVQHEGCYLRTLPEYGQWTFVEHSNKGRRPEPTKVLMEAEMITAACLVMSTATASELGGFDEVYVIGDFEDADLCRRLRARKQTVAVDPNVVCYHLERQSQARLHGHWRMNLTLFNAWNHQRRWIAPEAVRGEE
jgi:GT2 family glycosyltransferase